ncbi:MAG: superoxide dismutase [Phycisphaerae bacterium]|nr:superoxide dismutase [Phycisphaerae bacterium]
MNLQLPLLGYDYGALEPFIDGVTMEIHHRGYHAMYIDRLRQLLADQEPLRRMSLEEILSDIRVVPEEIRQEFRNCAGGHLNHSLLWHTLSPESGKPHGAVLNAIDASFGDVATFQNAFARAAMSRFGSGWAWLCMNSIARLEILSLPNQDSPIMLGYRPVLGLDVWEHAYFLKYQNRRPDYIDAWWQVVHWGHVNEVYQHYLEMASRAH